MEIFETFKCSGQNSSNSLCQLWNDKSASLQIMGNSSLSWQITPLWILSSYFFKIKLKHRLIPFRESTFFEAIPSVLGRSVNFNITSRFLLRRPVFPDYLFLVNMVLSNFTSLWNSSQTYNLLDCNKW